MADDATHAGPAQGGPTRDLLAPGEPEREALTEDEQETLRTAALGALGAVSRTDPSLLQRARDGLANAKEFASAPPELRELLRDLRPPVLGGSAAEVEERVLRAATTSASILEHKSQIGIEAFRNVALAACDVAASANAKLNQAELLVIDRLREALDRSLST